MNEYRSIVVFHAGALGDLVNTLPALAGLRDRFPGARITAVGNRNWLTLFQAGGRLDEAISLERPGLHRLFGEEKLPPDLVQWLAEFDLAVSWMRAPTLRAHLARAGARTVALSRPFPPPPGSEHVCEYMAQPLHQLGIVNFPASPRLRLPEQLFSDGPRFPGIIVHPGSGSPLKNWPADRFAATTRRLMDRTRLPAAVLAGPADETPVRQLTSILSNIKVFRDLAPFALASLLSSAALVLANDSGVAHLSGALGAPVVAVFGPTDPAVWGVRQDHAVNLAPSGPREQISPATVAQAAVSVLQVQS